MSVTSGVVDGVPVVRARSLQEWRDWLEENGQRTPRVWLIVYKKGASQDSVRFRDAIEHALCFGWVDSKAVRRDRDSCYLMFSQRSPRSSWGRVSRERAERLTRAGHMRPAGQKVIDEAKASGRWDEHADAQNLVVPDDLRAALEANRPALAYFSAFPPRPRDD